LNIFKGVKAVSAHPRVRQALSIKGAPGRPPQGIS